MPKHAALFSLALAAGLGFAVSVQALSVNPGNLIKGPGDTVYFYSKDGQRHVFPNLKTYLTWYPDFSQVKSMPLSELQTLPLGGKNVTYKPGAKLVKITTNPRVYAIGAHATLRWVHTEAVAQALYGADWNKKIDDIPDAYFVNYHIGSPITSSADFSPSAELAAATDIDADLSATTVPTTPTTTTTTTPTTTSTTTTPTATTTASSITFTSSKQTLQAGDVVTLVAQAQDPSGISKTELFFDGSLVKTCPGSSCSGDATVPISGTKDSYVAEGRATTVSQQVLSKTLEMPVKSDGKTLVTVQIGQAQIAPNMAASAIADVDSSIAIQRIDIYVDNSIVKGCATTAHRCQWSDYLSNQTIGSVHPVKAVVTDTIGRTYSSGEQTITVSTTDSPAVTILPAKDMIYAGETLDVTVTASDDDGIASMDILKDGVVLKHCDSAAPCTATTGPWNTVGTLIFTGRATDPKSTIGYGTSTAVTVSPKP